MYIISYDIQKDKTRSRLHKILKDYGVWVQYSLFECDITKDEFEKLFKKLKIINLENDSIKIYIVCKDCFNKVINLGKQTIRIDDAAIVI